MAAASGSPAIRQAGELRSAPLESLRAVAALAVLEGHIYGENLGYGATAYGSWWHRTLLGGGFGVDLFFCLSGYLLFLPFARATFGEGRAVDLRRYARNRAVRILPLYYVVVITYLLVERPPRFVWAAYLLLGENFSHRTVGQVDGPTWSLVVEVLFYVLLPFLAAALARIGRRSMVPAVVALAALAAASGAYRWVAYLHVVHPSPLVRYNLPANFFFFVPGMLLALSRVGAERRGGVPGLLKGPLGSSWVWLVASAACWALLFRRYEWELIAGAASFLLVGACVLPLRGAWPVRVLGWRPLAALGTASYSLYIWHLPIVRALAPKHLGGYAGHLVLDVVICVAVAAASYLLIEAPFLRLRRAWGDTAAAERDAPPVPVRVQA